jgi:hypothetical protein
MDRPPTTGRPDEGSTVPGPTVPVRVARRVRGLLADTRPLRTPAFRRLWVAEVLLAFAGQFSIVAVPKQVYDLTGSSAWVGVAAGVALVPLLIGGLWGGALADALDRRTLLLVTAVGEAATAICLLAQAALRLNSVWLILVLLGAQQLLLAVELPTASAISPRLLPARELPAASALMMTMNQLGAIVGPLIAGVLLAVFSLPVLYLVSAMGVTAALLPLSRLPHIPPLPAAGGAGVPGGARRGRRGGLRDVLEGFGYVRRQQVLLASFLVDILAMAAGMPRALYPELSRTVFGDRPGGGTALGWLYSAIAIGAVLGGVGSGWFSRVRRQGVAVVVAVCVWGAGVAAFGLARQLWLAVALLAVAGAADMVSAAFRNVMLQTAATDELRGRMQGVFTVVVAGGPRLGDVLHGAVGSVIGASLAVTGGGLLVIVLVLIAATFLPAFLRYAPPRHPAHDRPQPAG